MFQSIFFALRKIIPRARPAARLHCLTRVKQSGFLICPDRPPGRNFSPVRRRVSIIALCLAWLCANGAIWNVVQVVAWAKMFHDYSQVMPVAKALEITFDGSAPCDLCHISQQGQDAAREQLPREAALGSGEKILLATESTTTFVLTAPDFAWPGGVHDAGPARTELVPVPPPRV